MGGPLGMYEGKFTVNALSLQLYDGTPATVSITAGDYYLRGYDGEASGSLLGTIQAGIRAVSGQSSTNVSLNVETGKVHFNFTSARACNFITSRLANILGISNGLVQPSSATHIGASAARYTWRPSKAPALQPVGIREVFGARSSSVTGRSKDGTTFGIKGSLLEDGAIEYHHLPASEVIRPDSGTVYLDLRQWWEDVAHEAMPYRFVMNREQYASTSDFKTAIWHEDGQEEVGQFIDAATRSLGQSYNGRWSVRIPMSKKL